MWISRVRVTGGFLAGLDVALTQDLNVVIGPRGAGKTTLLELLRHALAAGHADVGDGEERQQFLDAVLGPDGEVIVDVEADDGGRHLVVDHLGGGQRSDLGASVLALGQNELEEIASDAQSRLSLLDLRINAPTLASADSAAGLTGALFELRVELESRGEEAAKRSRLESDRALLVSQEAALIGDSTDALAAQRDLLRQAEERIIETNGDLEILDGLPDQLQEIASNVSQEARRIHEVTERTARLRHAAPEILQAFGEANSLAARLIQSLRESHELLGPARERIATANIAAREEAAPIREGLEESEAGLGRLTAQLRNVHGEIARLDANDETIVALQASYDELIQRRQQAYAAVEQREEALFAARHEVAEKVTAQTANGVVVDVQHLADSSALRTFLQGALAGTRTRTSLIDIVADRTLPRQLLELVESCDGSGLAAVAGISVERAEKLVYDLNNRETLEGLSEVRLADSVDFRLRDGAVDKSVDELSTGQKCAVTLPIVLSEQERILILDQPEDHLDNEYLVRNVLPGLTDRCEAGAQTIVATHNANIPVLGSAATVIALASDGKNGSIGASGPFDSAPIVERITSLMEGGREAFARRYAFYAKHGEVE